MNTRQGSSAPLRVAKDGSRATPTQTAVTHLAHQVLGRVRLMKACKHDGRRKNRNYHDDLYKNESTPTHHVTHAVSKLTLVEPMCILFLGQKKQTVGSRPESWLIQSASATALRSMAQWGSCALNRTLRSFRARSSTRAALAVASMSSWSRPSKDDTSTQDSAHRVMAC